jgi:hypothetical protein
MLPDFRKIIDFGRFPSFAHLSFREEEHVDEDEYGALLDW